jgi:hypothetical protein
LASCRASGRYPDLRPGGRAEIVKILKKHGRVTMYARNPSEYEWKGLLLDPIVAIEHKLIKLLNPEWNKQHTKTGLGKRVTPLK